MKGNDNNFFYSQRTGLLGSIAASNCKFSLVLSTIAWAMRCGIPYDKALSALQADDRAKGLFSSPVWKESVWDLVVFLRAGLPLSVGIGRLRRNMPSYVQSGIREAEKRDSLDKVIPLLAEQMRHSDAVFKERACSFTYSFLQLFQVLLLVSALFMFIIPRIGKLLAEYNSPLPALTGALFYLNSHWGYFSFYLIMLIMACAILKILYHFDTFAVIGADVFLLRIPFVGKDMKRLALFEFAAGMACYLETGMDVAEAAEICSKTVSQAWMRKRIGRFAENVRKGMKWTDAWEQLGLGLPFYSWLARNSASREKAREGFTMMTLWLRSEISEFTALSVVVVEISGLLLNAILVGVIVLGLGSGIFQLIHSAVPI